MSDTGNGATFVLASGFTAKYIEIGATTESVAVLPYSGLSTTGHEEVCPGDLITPDAITLRGYFSSTALLPALGVTTTATMTMPVPAGLTNGATLSGTGFVSSRTGPSMANNQLHEFEFTWQWDGITGPTYTAAS